MLRSIFCLLFIWTLTSCGGLKTAQDTSQSLPSVSTDDGKIEIVFFHINDVYEIAPLENGQTGGMARVAALYKKIKNKNPHTFFVHGGDFLSPSLIGTLTYNGERIRGKQMVEVMNAAGVQLVVFGNHEFDVKEYELQSRINESDFYWLGTTVRHRVEDKVLPFHKEKEGEYKECPDSFIWRVEDSDGTVANVGVFGLTIGSNPQDYVQYLNTFQMATQAANDLKEKADVVVGLTHQERLNDIKLAGMLPYVPLILGGHDHDNSIDRVGETVIVKADANVKTVYVVKMLIDKNENSVKVEPELIRIDDSLPSDPAVEALVKKWGRIQDENLQQVVKNPYEVIYQGDEPLDGLESSVRNQQTNLGQLIANAMWKAAPKAECAFFNGGSIRIDDKISGNVQAIDIFRALPFGGGVVEVEMTGGLLTKILDTGLQNKGTGGYLQWANIRRNDTDTHWLVGGQTVDPERIYRVATTGFLLTGKETRMDFFTPKHPDVKAVHKTEKKNDPRWDIRKAVIMYMKK